MNAFFEAYIERMEKLHNQIKQAIQGLPLEALDWVPGPEMNSLSVLIVHTTGSERYWIGDVALEEASGRDRDAEFRAHGLDGDALKARLDSSLVYARDALSRLPENNLALERFSTAWGESVTIVWALLHALEHLGIHLGHIQMVRQLWDQKSK
jgi:uncharacterized damage-inducible protein DinB